MPATRHDETPSFSHGLFNRRYHLIGRADQPHVVRPGAEPFIETLIDYRAILRIVGADFARFDPRVVDRLLCRHRLLWVQAVCILLCSEHINPERHRTSLMSVSVSSPGNRLPFRFLESRCNEANSYREVVVRSGDEIAHRPGMRVLC